MKKILLTFCVLMASSLMTISAQISDQMVFKYDLGKKHLYSNEIPLAYNATNGTVTILAQKDSVTTTVASGLTGKGVYLWTPAEPGVYELTYVSGNEVLTSKVISSVQKSSDNIAFSWSCQSVIKIGSNANGTVAAFNGSDAMELCDTVECESVITLTAHPKSGYHFLNWTKGKGGEVLSSDLTYTFTASTDAEVYANFNEPKAYLIYDDFQQYTTGNHIASEAIAAGNNWWSTWSNAPGSAEDGLVAQYGSTLCGHFTYNHDQVLLLGGMQSGDYGLEMDVLTPSGKNGYFNFLHAFAGNYSTWAAQIYLNAQNDGSYTTPSTGHGTVHAAGTSVADIQVVEDAWMHFRFRFNLDVDSAEMYYTAPGKQEVCLHKWLWSWDSFRENMVGKKLDALDFFPPENAATSEFYIDNIELYRNNAYSIVATSNIPGAGNISGSGTYPVCDTAVLTAVSNANYVFIGWSHEVGGAIFSFDTTLSVVANNDTSFVANFAQASLCVTTTNDDGEGSLRKAIRGASSGQTITFAPHLDGDTILLSSTLTVNSALNIDASHLPNGVAISVQPLGRAFVFDGMFSDTLKGLTITGCKDTTGAAVMVNANTRLVMLNCNLEQNTASNVGGALYVKGKLQMLNCRLSRNEATNEGAVIYVDNNSKSNIDTISLYNCLVVNNVAERFCVFATCTLELHNCTFCHNSILSDTAFLHTISGWLYNNIFAQPEKLAGADSYLRGSCNLSTFTGWKNAGYPGVKNYMYNDSLPLFDGDYHLHPLATQAINKGFNNSVQTKFDLDGKTRVVGDTVDLGAFEMQIMKKQFEFASDTMGRVVAVSGGDTLQSGDFVETSNSVTITAYSDLCHSFTAWTNGESGDTVSTENPYHFVMVDNINLYAHFDVLIDSTEFSDAICDSYTWNNVVYTHSGDYVQHFANVNGCDSVVTLHLTIYKTLDTLLTTVSNNEYCGGYANGVITLNPVPGYEYSFDGNTYDSVYVTRNLLANTYTVYARPIGSNCVYSREVVVKDSVTMPVAVVSADDTILCTGTSLRLTANGSSVGQHSYSWRAAADYPNVTSITTSNIPECTYAIYGTRSMPPEANDRVKIYPGAQTGYYVMTVTDTVTHCMASDSIYIRVNAPGNPEYAFAITDAPDVMDTIHIYQNNISIKLAQPTVAHYLTAYDSNYVENHLIFSNDAPATYDTAGTYTITWIATDDCGNMATATQLVTVFMEPCPNAIDYDGNEYTSVKLHAACWLTENLRSYHYADGRAINNVMTYYSVTHSDTVENRTIYGNLYHWRDAFDAANGVQIDVNGHVQGICPEGWFLPSYIGINFISDEYSADDLRTVDLWLGVNGTNLSGLSLVPGGWFNASTQRYENMLGEAYYWIVSSDDTPSIFCISGRCPIGKRLNAIKNGCSVRCVKR